MTSPWCVVGVANSSALACLPNRATRTILGRLAMGDLLRSLAALRSLEFGEEIERERGEGCFLVLRRRV